MAALTLALVLVGTSVLSLVAVLLVAALFDRRDRKVTVPSGGAVARFLFDSRGLVDANRQGRELLRTLARLADGCATRAGLAGGGLSEGGLPGGGLSPEGARDLLIGHLTPTFPDLPSRFAAATAEDAAALSAGSATGGWTLTAATAGGDGGPGEGLSPGLCLSGRVGSDGTLHLTLAETPDAARASESHDDTDEAILVDRLSWRAMAEELDTLRRSIDLSPSPAWRETADGRIVWANGAYLRLLREVEHGAPLTWPLPALFQRAGPGGAAERPERPVRQSLSPGPRGRPMWFDLVETRDGDQNLVHALPADEAHRAERTRREFVQTLTKTFATLPIGLAVFDRSRRLHLFNPALTDLTGLEPEFLAARPGLDGFLNRLRDKHVLPEPRDFRAWSRRLLEVEAAGSGPGFEETWSLADGRCFRFSAAPHPDGALALLIEDVTADIRLKRSYRAEIDQSLLALDMIDTALAIFAPSGDLVLTNAHFDRLWTLEGAETLVGVSFREAVTNWRETGDDPVLWDRIAALGRPGARETEVAGRMRLSEGETFDVRARLAPTGGVILSFREQDELRPVAAPPRLRRATA